MSIQVAPRGIAVQQQHRGGVARPRVEVVDADRGAVGVDDLAIVRGEVEILEHREAVIGSAQYLHVPRSAAGAVNGGPLLLPEREHVAVRR